MNALSQAASVSSLELGAPAPEGQWIHLLPLGRFKGRDGRSFAVSDPARLIGETRKRQGDELPIDYEHQTDFAPTNGQPAPAAGWIKSLQVRESGIWGLVGWTRRAAEHLAAKEYRFISPTFLHTASGEITCLLRAGLTNAPNLELAALARASDAAESEMIQLTELTKLLQLPEDAPLDAIIEAVRTLVEAKASNAADPARFVPIDVFERVTAEFNRVHNGVSAEAAAICVDREIQSGRLFPSLRDWAVSLCRVNKPAFDSFVHRTGADLQQLFRPTPNPGRGDPQSDDGLTAKIARQLGHSPADLA